MKLSSILVLAHLLTFTLLHAKAAFGKPTEFIIYTESWAPYTYSFEDNVVGISTDIVREMFTRSNLSHDIVLVPWARAYKSVQAQENAFIFMTKRTPEREPLFHWIGPIQVIDLYLYQLAARNELNLSSLNELYQHTIGVEQDGSSHAELLRMGLDEQTHIYPVNNFSQLVGMLFKQRIDFVISEDTSLRFQLQMTGYSRADIKPSLLFSTGGRFYLAANKSVDPAVINALQFQLDELVRQGITEEINRRYLQD